MHAATDFVDRVREEEPGLDTFDSALGSRRCSKVRTYLYDQNFRTIAFESDDRRSSPAISELSMGNQIYSSGISISQIL
jgi:hypothetical protein